MRWIAIFSTLAIQFTGLCYFCFGFFPSKAVLPGFGQFSHLPAETNGSFPSQFNKVVIIVIDALRSDFMFSGESSMPFVHSLINKGSAKGFTAFSNPPTVTLPRLKGITTGSTPSFLDAVLNIVEEDTSSTLALQDSWLKQLKLANKKIHMYGDDTWLKLFPGFFDAGEGTSSFFVSDFTEVDSNVTRHLDHELNVQDWDCLILHYLGLDHIGHKGGPDSIFMPAKQREMDGIIERVYNRIDDDILLVVLGDHGMNEIGNHGGSSAGETSAALLFVSDKLQQLKSERRSAPLPTVDDYSYYGKVQQIDLVPTLSGLLRLPIPRNSLGIFIRELLPLWNSKDRKNVILDNAKHLSKFQSFNIADDEDTLYETLRDTQSTLIREASNYNLLKLHTGLALVFLSAIASSFIASKVAGHHSLFIGAFIVIFSLSFFGSSLVEEEHQIWWWLTTLSTTTFSYSHKWSLLALISCERILRGWNSSGQKFVGDTVVSHLKKNVLATWCVNIITLLLYGFNWNGGDFSQFNRFILYIFSFVSAMLILSYKLLFSVANGDMIPKCLIKYAALTINIMGNKNAEDSLLELAQMIFMILGVIMVIRLAFRQFFKTENYFQDLHNIISLLLIMQTSIYNIGIFTILFFIKKTFIDVSGSYRSDLDAKSAYISILVVVLQNLTFFSFGQTNSLATVDLSNSYNGVSSFNLISTGLLTFFGNFSGPIYWSFASLPIIFECNESSYEVKWQILKVRWAISLLYYSITTFAVLASCYIQRYHLFIWTVFSPKILYTLVWNFIVNGIIELVILVIVYLS